VSKAHSSLRPLERHRPTLINPRSDLNTTLYGCRSDFALCPPVLLNLEITFVSNIHRQREICQNIYSHEMPAQKFQSSPTKRNNIPDPPHTSHFQIRKHDPLNAVLKSNEPYIFPKLRKPQPVPFHPIFKHLQVDHTSQPRKLQKQTKWIVLLLYLRSQWREQHSIRCLKTERDAVLKHLRWPACLLVPPCGFSSFISDGNSTSPSFK
jgi:hypothetical protein